MLVTCGRASVINNLSSFSSLTSLTSLNSLSILITTLHTHSNANGVPSWALHAPSCSLLEFVGLDAGMPYPLLSCSMAKGRLTNPTPSYPTDALCTRVLLNRILGDYLEVIYPLIPVVYGPSFRQDLARDKDLYDKNFLVLVICLCVTTVGIVPSRFREYQFSDVPIVFQTQTEMINYCYGMCTGLRGPDYFDEINFQK
jgi:hypothetical protein